MGHVDTTFRQALSFVHRRPFEAIVSGLNADRFVKTFDPWSHLVAMLFAQATGKDSLRDLEAAFNADASSLYHLGAQPTLAFIKAQARFQGSKRILTEMIGTALFMKRLIIGLLNLNEKTIRRINDPPGRQLSLPLMP